MMVVARVSMKRKEKKLLIGERERNKGKLKCY
jgi:hypothetical protein